MECKYITTLMKAMGSLSLIIKNSFCSKTSVRACAFSSHVYALFNKELR